MAKRTKEQLAKKLQAWIKKHGEPTASLSAIRPNPDNPRTITEDALYKLCCQLADMPQTLQARCIVYDENSIILGGNMRYAALGELGIAEVPENWLFCIEGLTDEQKQQFILLDNTGAGQWNWDMLANEWNSDLIADWGPVVPGWDVSGLAGGTERPDYYDTEGSIDDGSAAPKASDDDYSVFELVMLHENKLHLLDILAQVKRNYLFEKQEDALMEVLRQFENQNNNSNETGN